MIWELPTSLEVNGQEWEIRTDFRDILNILLAFDDPELIPAEKQYVALCILYKDFERMSSEDYSAAYKQAIWFIDNGKDQKKDPGPRTMDWAQDASILFPAINTVAGKEVRELPHLHWWTFLGYFMEIRSGVYSTVLQLRSKKARKKKLEKDEQEFWRKNRDICELKPRLTAAEKEEKARLKAILGG